MMPRGGAETRAEGLATLHRLAHELFVRDEIGELLERLEPDTSGLDPDSDDACLVAVTRRTGRRRGACRRRSAAR